MLSGPQNSEFLFSKVLEIGTQRSIKYSRLQIDLILSINKNKEPHKIKLIQCLNSSGDIVADLQLIFMFVLCIFLKFVGFDVKTAVGALTHESHLFLKARVYRGKKQRKHMVVLVKLEVYQSSETIQ